MEPTTEGGREAFIFGRNGCSGFGHKASETPGGMRSTGKKKNGFDLVDQKGTVANSPINGEESSQPLP